MYIGIVFNLPVKTIIMTSHVIMMHFISIFQVIYFFSYYTY
jgi:hypothetical protein